MNEACGVKYTLNDSSLLPNSLLSKSRSSSGIFAHIQKEINRNRYSMGLIYTSVNNMMALMTHALSLAL